MFLSLLEHIRSLRAMYAKVDCLQEGMSEAEVLQLMGDPMLRQTLNTPGEPAMEEGEADSVWVYGCTPRRVFYVFFLQGKALYGVSEVFPSRCKMPEWRKISLQNEGSGGMHGHAENHRKSL